MTDITASQPEDSPLWKALRIAVQNLSNEHYLAWYFDRLANISLTDRGTAAVEFFKKHFKTMEAASTAGEFPSAEQIIAFQKNCSDAELEALGVGIPRRDFLKTSFATVAAALGSVAFMERIIKSQSIKDTPIHRSTDPVEAAQIKSKTEQERLLTAAEGIAAGAVAVYGLKKLWDYSEQWGRENDNRAAAIKDLPRKIESVLNQAQKIYQQNRRIRHSEPGASQNR